MNACYFGRAGEWKQSEKLWDALDMEGRMEHFRRENEDAPFVVSFAGAGGKTSLIRRLAWEGRERGHKVLVLTTTHMYRPTRFGVLDKSPGAVDRMLCREALAVAGHLEENGKISFQGWDYYREIIPLASLVLVEADGSRRLPVKTPGPGEPVIPENIALMLCVSGLTAVGGAAKDVCFRLEQAEAVLGIGEEQQAEAGSWLLTPERVERLMVCGYLLPWRKKVWQDGKDVIPVFNQADTEKQKLLGRTMLEHMGESSGIVTGNLHREPSFELF